MLGEVRRFYFYVFKNLPDGKLSLPQGFDHVNAGGVCKNLEDSRLKGAEGFKMFGVEGGFQNLLQYIRKFESSKTAISRLDRQGWSIGPRAPRLFVRLLAQGSLEPGFRLGA